MSREEELKEYTNKELREMLAEDELDTKGNKDELVERIVRFELGLPEPDADADEAEADAEEADANGEAAVEDADDDDVPSEDSAPADEPTVEAAEAEKDEDLCLVKYLGKSPHFEASGYTFSVAHPFVAVSKDACNNLVANRPRYFRTATEAEVERYYG